MPGFFSPGGEGTEAEMGARGAAERGDSGGVVVFEMSLVSVGRVRDGNEDFDKAEMARETDCRK